MIDINNVQSIKQTISKKGNLKYSGGLAILGKFDEGKCLKLTMKNGKA